MLGIPILDEFNLISVFLRFVMAVLLGGILGMERSRKGRAAGFRTHILVCMGSAAVMMTAIYMTDFLGYSSDPARLGAQVVSGIGFLGAGTILVTGKQEVKGLTTAAGLWANACMGLAIGVGFYVGALLMCILMLSVMTIMDLIEERFLFRTVHRDVFVVLRSVEYVQDFMEMAKDHNILLLHSAISDSEAASQANVGLLFSLKLPRSMAGSEVLSLFRECKGLLYIEER